MRKVNTVNNLTADVEGDIEEVAGVLKITKIRLNFRLKAAAGEQIDRALRTYAEKCPAYQSVKGCIECSWTLELQE